MPPLPAASSKLTGVQKSARSVEGRRNPVVDGELCADSPPVGLRADAKSAWTAAIENAPKGMLTALDASVLERWCRTWALYRKVARMVEDEDVALIDDPAKLTAKFNAMTKLHTILMQCEKELGFTPVARARVRAPEPDNAEKSPFDDL